MKRVLQVATIDTLIFLGTFSGFYIGKYSRSRCLPGNPKIQAYAKEIAQKQLDMAVFGLSK